jgi:hypothetical protein
MIGMLSHQMKSCKATSVLLFLILLLLITVNLPLNVARASSVRLNNLHYYLEGDSVRVILDDVELYFNATNGGEITEYYDLCVDPERNLANMSLIRDPPQRPLCSLTSSVFYLSRSSSYGTGFDMNAEVQVIGNSTDYVVLQTSSKLVNLNGQIAKDLQGHVLHVNSTWILFSDGHVFLERTLCALYGIEVPSGWGWYPLYVTRTLGFNSKATFYMFNTTDAFTTTADWNVVGTYSSLPVFPNDMNGIFGIAAPFSNVSLGGDEGHNIVLIYKYNELDIAEWKSDNYNGDVWQTGFGAKHIFEKSTRISTHKFCASIYFTHQMVSEQNVVEYAEEYKNAAVFPLFTCNITTNAPVFHRGDLIQVFLSVKSYYNLDFLRASHIANNSYGNLFQLGSYGPFSAPENFSVTNYMLLSNTVSQSAEYGNYTLTFQISSSLMVIAQNSTAIAITGSE